jgi:hypothetical protein
MSLVSLVAIVSMIMFLFPILAQADPVMSSTTNITVAAGASTTSGTYYWTNTSQYASIELLWAEIVDATASTTVTVSKVGNASDTTLTYHCVTIPVGSSSNAIGYVFGSNNAPIYAVNGEVYKIKSQATNYGYKFRLAYRQAEHP